VPRPTTLRRDVKNFLRDKLLPGQIAEIPLTFFARPKGENRIKALTELSPDESPFVKNLSFSPDSMYVTRNGTELVGGAAATAICGAVIFSTRTSSDYIVRVTTTGVEYWGGTTWTALTGPALTLAQDTRVEFTVWDDKLLFTDATTALYSINFADGTYAAIPGAAVGRHITTFGSRVIVSYIVIDANPAVPGTFVTRIEWCVKNDNTDWLGLGSGYEDLLSSPGGTVDVQHGVIPVTDVEAFVIRSSSIWVMNTTGYFDTPFQFTYRFDQGTDAPGSIVRTPSPREQAGGSLFAQIIMLSTDDVVVVRPEGITPIGFPIRYQLLGTTLNPRKAIAGFEPRNREYWIHVPPLANNNTTSIVWKYRIDDNSWYHSEYPFKLERLAFKDILFAATFDELTGTFDALTGFFDDLGLGARQPSAILVSSSQPRVIREREGVVGDVTALGTATGIAIEIQTGMIQPDDPRKDLTVLMLELLYEADQSVDVDFEYSTNGGTTWSAYGSLTLAATTQPTLVAYRNTLHRRRMQVRMKSDDGSTLQLHALYVKAVKGSDIHQ